MTYKILCGVLIALRVAVDVAILAALLFLAWAALETYIMGAL